ncbi:unnamed protein product [Sphagnum troendelagicum]|uniref:Protein PEP-RELATED DEVELOPMENT ARRESTED 1, chloroplastic n=1 Tax=Sphagnum troendelagicum TaxID=128251 RepID=A0ABP0TCK5_9BRYO
MTMRGGSVVGCWPQPMLHLSCTFPFLLHHKACSSYLSFVVSSFPRIPGKCSTAKASVSYSRGENPNAWCRNGARWKCRGGGGLESGCVSSSCSSSSSPGGFGNWEPRKVRTGLLVKKKRRAVLQAAAGEESKTGEKVDYRAYQALMRGGEEVIDLLKEMTELLEDITEMGNEAEDVAIEMAATGAVGQRLEKLDESFLMALDWMILQAEDDDKAQRQLLEVIKDTVLAQLAQKFPSQVQIVGMLCRTPDKDARQEILRRCAGGGGTFEKTGGGKIALPATNLNDVANQADDLIVTMEEKSTVPDRRLLARLVLVREEARSLLSGGLLDERNDRTKFRNLPEPEVNFLSKIVGLRPGPDLHKRLANVIGGQDEGADIVVSDEQGHPHNSKAQAPPFRPGMFLETVTKVLGGMYETKAAGGVTFQQLEWIHKETLKILQDLAFS